MQSYLAYINYAETTLSDAEMELKANAIPSRRVILAEVLTVMQKYLTVANTSPDEHIKTMRRLRARTHIAILKCTSNKPSHINPYFSQTNTSFRLR